ncbi:MAG: hypothetical protein L0332_24075 [Chloroflexi bacterium]|nr:hypothetical protein [Chloroflexota bacterium]MCI0645179.1 hypothetical protein [Chloroflexota bacterium]MCI0729772.1 hypothetical protein [Chloroflexota bacterium]
MSQPQSFAAWMRQVNAAVFARAFVSADDLPDQPYRDWYDDGLSPEEAAGAALEDAGFDEAQEGMSDDFDLFYEELFDD